MSNSRGRSGPPPSRYESLYIGDYNSADYDPLPPFDRRILQGLSYDGYSSSASNSASERLVPAVRSRSRSPPRGFVRSRSRSPEMQVIVPAHDGTHSLTRQMQDMDLKQMVLYGNPSYDLPLSPQVSSGGSPQHSATFVEGYVGRPSSSRSRPRSARGVPVPPPATGRHRDLNFMEARAASDDRQASSYWAGRPDSSIDRQSGMSEYLGKNALDNRAALRQKDSDPLARPYLVEHLGPRYYDEYESTATSRHYTRDELIQRERDEQQGLFPPGRSVVPFPDPRWPISSNRYAGGPDYRDRPRSPPRRRSRGWNWENRPLDDAFSDATGHYSGIAGSGVSGPSPYRTFSYRDSRHVPHFRTSQEDQLYGVGGHTWANPNPVGLNPPRVQEWHDDNFSDFG
ncbi:hypothetical protein MPTK1_2g13760 [Marchantia polymorpha subsp. ruderalis]|nr:hypothetical protein MARPO_0042s0005 [Marchantia polymorpha]PTQ39934.1 hypothetical protein MARPO_0042s0005 [Marchantia polymorpha]BBN02232.1 hypothetical protein Mp_2g13760 [Marchantia polymorpha subsp. ruderalis]BBN02233.1 hypothetical protein Mp_2g13760 [Marchantia polymorpha subsp. ruderalis]|eukprot:PTQ39933.1 hypothetical protein MARPO_0042s0005 [Marchantia polymorpha]